MDDTEMDAHSQLIDTDKIKTEPMSDISEVKVEDEELAKPFSYHLIKTEDTSYDGKNVETMIIDQVKRYDDLNMDSSSMETNCKIWKTDLNLNIDEQDMDSTYSKMHKCHLCDYSSNESNLRKHMDCMHLNLNQSEYKPDMSNFEGLMNSSAASSKTFACHHCNYTANLKSNVKAHMVRIHSNSKDFKCQLCAYASNDRRNLKKHVKAVHLYLKAFECHLCGFTANQKTKLEKHIKLIHLNLKLQPCHLCDHVSTCKSSLKQHIEAIHLNMKKFKCQMCKYAAYYNKDLKNHIDSVHLKTKKFECHLCEYVTNAERYLKRHMNRVHSGKD